MEYDFHPSDADFHSPWKRLSPDDWMYAQGGKMMIRAICEYIRRYRPAGCKSGLSISCEQSPFVRLQCSDEQILDAILRYSNTTDNCDKFIHQDFDFKIDIKHHTDKKGKTVIDRLDFI